MAFPVPTLPIAPEPFVPVVSTPAKLITSIDETTFCDSVAAADPFVTGLAAKARHISELPSCVFVRCTRVHVSPAPVTPVTVVFEDNASVDTSASTSSFPTKVENVPLVIVVDAAAWSFATNASIARLPGGGGREFVTVNVALMVDTKVPEIKTAVGTVTPNVVTVKFALNWPAGTVTVTGTLATAGLALVSETGTPPAAAAWPSITVPCTVFPPETLFAFNVREVRVWAVVVAETVTPGDGISRFPLSSAARLKIV